MREWAAQASVGPDSKADVFLAWINEHLRPGGKWSDERVIIFTEYRATQKYLLERLAYAGLTEGERVLTLYGGMDRDQREAVKAAFQFDPKHSPVRILVATDAASEGIDLQNHCARLIHYEIPWNPNRMEQRNGRIDRHGQKADAVNIYHFVGAGYRDRLENEQLLTAGELEGDLEFLMVAASKVNTIREDLGKVGPVIAEQVEQAMLGHRQRLATRQAEKDAEPVRRMLKFERDLRQQIEQLRNQLDETKRHLHLTPANVQRVVEVALDLADQPALIPADFSGVANDPKQPTHQAFQLPALRGSWQYCAEGLRRTFDDEIRPLVFDHDLANGRDDVILAHLNHRLVQMSLRLLRAEVWSTESKKRLNRMTARVVPNEVLRDPAMIVHARLVVIGGDSHRLHEEIIYAGGMLREGRFTRITTLRELDEALDAATNEQPSDTMRQRLLDLFPTRVDSLRSALEARMSDRTKTLETRMADRAQKETQDISTILKELAQTIESQIAQIDPQMSFEGWTNPEREQLETNMSALQHRLTQLPTEIKRESAAIQARFANPQARLFPVCVTFLVPNRLAKG